MHHQNYTIMAMKISNIPVLEGNVAKEFVAIALENESNRGSINMSNEYNEMRKILANADFS